jgi:hypothetical protein
VASGGVFASMLGPDASAELCASPCDPAGDEFSAAAQPIADPARAKTTGQTVVRRKGRTRTPLQPPSTQGPVCRSGFVS